MSEDERHPVTLAPENDGTQESEHIWELSPWDTYWGRLVYPLLVANGERRLFPVGTAFSFSKLNHVVTARHNVGHALRKFHPNSREFVRKGIEAARNRNDLHHTPLVILSQGPNPRVGRPTLDVRTLSSMHLHEKDSSSLEVSGPTDLLVGNILSDEHAAFLPRMVPVVTFAPPRIGEMVYCVGFTDMTTPEGGLSTDHGGGGLAMAGFGQRLLAVRGSVTNIFVDRFTRGFGEGPCFSVDVDVPGGLSGGPVLREDGAICGVVYHGATNFFNSPASICSLLYPIFNLRVSFGRSFAEGKVRFTATERSIAELVATRAIRTDRAEEEQVHITPEDDGLRVGVAVHRDDFESVFADFNSYQRGESMPPMQPTENTRGFKPNLEHPLVRKRQGF